MFETYEKPIQLKSMGKEKGIVKIRYNKLFKKLKIKVYFRNKKVYSGEEKIDDKKSLELLEVVRNKDVSYYKELSYYSVYSGLNSIVIAYDENNEQVGNDLNGYAFKDFISGTDKKIEKIIVQRSIKNA
ncbi:MAG: hypothetical protein ABS916_09585 [Carnobacterium sp.]|uniref:hypothetical protein n=1 Tax=Carnobacterium sp. TaxID=48221 RepID=UPI003315E9FB